MKEAPGFPWDAGSGARPWPAGRCGPRSDHEPGVVVGPQPGLDGFPWGADLVGMLSPGRLHHSGFPATSPASALPPRECCPACRLERRMPRSMSVLLIRPTRSGWWRIRLTRGLATLAGPFVGLRRLRAAPGRPGWEHASKNQGRSRRTSCPPGYAGGRDRSAGPRPLLN